MLSVGPDYTSLLVGALIGLSIPPIFRQIRKSLMRGRVVADVPPESAPVLRQIPRLHVRFLLGSLQAFLILSLIFSFLPIIFGFRADHLGWKELGLIVLLVTLLMTGVFFVLRKRDVSWTGNWTDPAASDPKDGPR